MIPSPQFEILPSLPTYGPMPTAITENGTTYYSEGFVVRFYKSDGTNWVGNFKPGRTQLKQVIPLKNTSTLLVIAYGSGYLINPEETMPIVALRIDYENVFKASKDRIVLQSQSNLTIVEPDGNYWHTIRITWDGLADLKINGGKVSGLAFNPTADADEWVEFTYDLNTKVLTGGCY